MSTTAHENETLELTLDELDSVSGGGWVEVIWNVLHLLSGGGSSAASSLSAAYSQGRFSGCVSIRMGLLRNRSHRHKKPAGLRRRV